MRTRGGERGSIIPTIFKCPYLWEPAAEARLAPEPDARRAVAALGDGAVGGRRGAPRQDHVERARLHGLEKIIEQIRSSLKRVI